MEPPDATIDDIKFRKLDITLYGNEILPNFVMSDSRNRMIE